MDRETQVHVQRHVLLVNTLLLLLLRNRRKGRRREDGKPRRLKRSVWVKNIFQKRREQGEYHNLIQEMRLHDSENFFNYFRMSPQKFDELLALVGPRIQRQRTTYRESIPAGERLAITLRFLATGDSQQTISLSYRVGRSTICEIIQDTCDQLWKVLHPVYLKAPITQDDYEKISTDFWQMTQFPNCVGAIQGKHVHIQSPASRGPTSSVVVLGVSDAHYCFTLVDVGCFSGQSGLVFSESAFGRALESGEMHIPDETHLPGTQSLMPYVFVGDERFPLKPYLMRPFPDRKLTEIKRVYNYRLSRARRAIENTFGILVSRWRIMSRPILAKSEKVCAIVQAVCCLHNFLMKSEQTSQPMYCPKELVDSEDSQGKVCAGEWRSLSASDNGLTNISRLGSNTFSRSSGSLRDTFADFFVSEQGAVAWQYDCIHTNSDSEDNDAILGMP